MWKYFAVIFAFGYASSGLILDNEHANSCSKNGQLKLLTGQTIQCKIIDDGKTENKPVILPAHVSAIMMMG